MTNLAGGRGGKGEGGKGGVEGGAERKLASGVRVRFCVRAARD